MTDADVRDAKVLLGRIAEYVPSLAKADAKCNGFFCSNAQLVDKASCEAGDIPAAKESWCKVSTYGMCLSRFFYKLQASFFCQSHGFVNKS